VTVPHRLATRSWTAEVSQVPAGASEVAVGASEASSGASEVPARASEAAAGRSVVADGRAVGTGGPGEVPNRRSEIADDGLAAAGGPGEVPSSLNGPPGAAPVALLIHGVTSSSRTWWRVGPALVARGYHVLAVDLRGHGASPGVDGALVLADLTSDVLHTLRDEGAVFPDGVPPWEHRARVVAPPVDLVVGHSLGALVALDLLRRMPGLARRLVLEEPPGPTAVDWAAMADGIEADTRRARTDPDGMRGDMAAENPGWALEEVERRLDDLAACDAEGVAAALRGTVAFDGAGLAAAVELPTLLVIGLEDLGSALAGPDRKAMVSALGDRGTVEVLDSGHNLHREAFERYMEVLDHWLAFTSQRTRG
jgi:pimeloyl-ACP methyl ester carboxylesterase